MRSRSSKRSKATAEAASRLHRNRALTIFSRAPLIIGCNVDAIMSPVDLTDERQRAAFIEVTLQSMDFPENTVLAVIDVNTVDATGTPSRWVTLPYSSLESFTEKPGMEKFAEAIRQCQQLFPSAWIVLLLYPPDRNDIRPRYGPKSHAKQ